MITYNYTEIDCFLVLLFNLDLLFLLVFASLFVFLKKLLHLFHSLLQVGHSTRNNASVGYNNINSRYARDSEESLPESQTVLHKRDSIHSDMSDHNHVLLFQILPESALETQTILFPVVSLFQSDR